MNDDERVSSLRLVSNIMLKSKYDKDPQGYIVADLLPPCSADKRVRDSLTELQKKQFEKKLFYATKIIDE